MEGDWSHEGNGGEGEKDGQLQAGCSGRKGVRGEVQEGVSDQGCFYAVGDPTVVTEVPRENT